MKLKVAGVHGHIMAPDAVGFFIPIYAFSLFSGTLVNFFIITFMNVDSTA